MKQIKSILYFLAITLLWSCNKDDGKIDFTFLQVNDVYEIAPIQGGKFGGMARVETVHQDLLKENPNIMLVMAGDFLNPSLLGTIKVDGERLRGKQMVEVMNAMNFDLVAFGNHEFDLPYKSPSRIEKIAEKLPTEITEEDYFSVLENFFPDGMDDDDYLLTVFKYGDTVSSTAQMQAAESLGYQATFHTDGTEQKLLDLLDSGTPVPIGVLHKGPVSNPSGGGHWICLTGYDETHFWCGDPFGEMDVVNGSYVSNGPLAGDQVRYSRKNLMKRWLIDGSGADGWYMHVS